MKIGPSRYSCRSVPQMPHHSTSAFTCPGPTVGSGTSSMRMSPGPWNRAAFICYSSLEGRLQDGIRVGLVDEEPARGGVGERDAHVEYARPVGGEGDGDGAAGAELDLALAVDRDGAALHGDPVRDAGEQVTGVPDPDRGDDAGRDRGE